MAGQPWQDWSSTPEVDQNKKTGQQAQAQAHALVRAGHEEGLCLWFCHGSCRVWLWPLLGVVLLRNVLSCECPVNAECLECCVFELKQCVGLGERRRLSSGNHTSSSECIQLHNNGEFLSSITPVGVWLLSFSKCPDSPRPDTSAFLACRVAPDHTNTRYELIVTAIVFVSTF